MSLFLPALLLLLAAPALEQTFELPVDPDPGAERAREAHEAPLGSSARAEDPASSSDPFEAERPEEALEEPEEALEEPEADSSLPEDLVEPLEAHRLRGALEWAHAGDGDAGLLLALREVAEAEASVRQAVSPAAFGAIATLSLEPDRQLALSWMAGLGDASPALLEAALREAPRRLGSGALGDLLVQLAETHDETLTGAADAYLEAAAQIRIHPLRARALASLCRAGALPPEAQLRLLAAAREVSSDHALASLLVTFAQTQRFGWEVETTYLDVAAAVSAEHVRQGVLAALEDARPRADLTAH